MAKRRPITVVVPVYGDQSSVMACVRSLMETVDTQLDRVLLVNDCGPDADTIEAAILDLIDDRPAYRYERNPRNLGFVGTCNRAALELDRSANDILLLNSDTVVTAGWLDELGAVLHVDDSHGVVCARSTNATIASLPFRLRNARSPRTRDRSAEVLAALIHRLPRFSYPPVAMGFCFLIRRDLLDRFGLFDDVFAPGYGEENDFCLRIGREGLRSVMAHRVLVAHEGARSFRDARRARLRADHERILVSRHPDYPARVRQYLWCDIDPIDAFADVLAPKPPSPPETAQLETVLVTASRPTATLSTIATTPSDSLSISVLTHSRSARAWRRVVGADRVTTFGSEEGRVWDVAVYDVAAGSETRLRAGHAAPRLVSTSAFARGDGAAVLATAAQNPIDDEALRERWNTDAEQMRRLGIPKPRVPSARQRVRALLERHAPRLVAGIRGALRR